ncbi:MAG TPA: ABC transporter permease [Ktedonobacteraceae bacterium]|nr:ABC transporter permease [Ktedonobacteraceae bacterium]
MARSAKVPATRGGKALFPPTVTLALVRLRKTWGLLLITGVGFVAAVVLACAVPLYSDVSITAGLRGALTASSQNADIVVQSFTEQINPPVIAGTTHDLNQEFQDKIGPYLSPPQFSIQTPVLPIDTKILSSSARGSVTYKDTDNQLQLFGANIDQAVSHLTLMQGRLPKTVSSAPTNDDLGIALSQEGARSLKVKLGSVIYMKVALVYIPIKREEPILPFRVVGIFKSPDVNEPYWHGADFISVARGKPPFGPPGRIFTGLVSNETFIPVMSHLFKNEGIGALVLEIPFNLFWFYRFDPLRISIHDLAAIANGANTVQVDVANNPKLDQAPYVEKTQVFLPTDMLENYSSRIAIAQLPVTSLLVLVLGLVLFFVSLMAELLVERQADAMAILRSRGASRSQIFGSLVTQSIGLGLIALFVGPPLAILMVRLIAQSVLPPANQSALSIISGNPVQVVQGVLWYVLITVLVAIFAMVVAVNRTTRQDILSARREAARSQRVPLWQRLNLDIVAAIIMIVGYGFSYYLINAGILDPHLTLLLLSPLTLVGAVFLLIAGLLLFLRCFPYMLQFGSWLTARSRSAPPMLALAQMSRAPRQSIRLMLLLALATAFAIFTLVFTASQTQRILDVAAYQSGADFSGTIHNSVATPLQVTEETALYREIPGVISATVGNASSATAAGAILALPVEIRAVDAATFARTATWSEQDSPQPLSALMAQLSAQRASALSRLAVPAVVDSSAWQSLKLSPNASSFSLNFTEGTVNFMAIAEVQHIPTVDDRGSSTANSGSVPNGGILVDYPSFAVVYGHDFRASAASLPLNAVWLRTRDDAVSLAVVRKALNKGVLQLSPLNDRRAIIEALYQEPLYLDLIGILTFGASIALLLALVGNLIASWLGARGRLANFAVLRALGATPSQIAGILTWEQCVIYSTSILLGIFCGAIFSVLVVPQLIFTSVGLSGANSDLTSSQFYVAQSVPPIQIVIPTSLVVALAVLVIICIVALGMMIRVVSRPSISQTLRLNED